MIKSNGSILLNFFDAFKDGNSLYFSAWNVNGFFRYDLERKTTDYLGLFPGGQGRYKYGYYCDTPQKLYFSPCNENSIVGIRKNQWDDIEIIPIDDSFIGTSVARFGLVKYLNENLWFVPYSSHAVMQYNLLDKKVSYYPECFELCNRIKEFSKGPLFRGGFVLKSQIWFISIQSNIIICFDTVSKKTYCYKAGNNNDLFVNFCLGKDCFWILTRSGEVIKWNESQGVIMRTKVSDDEIYETQSIVYYKERIWIDLRNSRGIVALDSDKVKTIDVLLPAPDGIDSSIGSITVIDGEVFSFPFPNNMLYIINPIDHRLEKHCVELVSDQYERYKNDIAKKTMEEKSFFNENELFGVEDYLRGIICR